MSDGKRHFDYAVITSPSTGQPLGGSCVSCDGDTATIVFGGMQVTGKLAERAVGDVVLSSFVPGSAGRAPSK